MDILDSVRSVIAQTLKTPIDQLTPDVRLDELGAESLDVIEIVYGLEEKFNISIPFKADEAATVLTNPEKSGGSEMGFSTIGDLAEIVTKLVEAKASR